MNDVKQLEANNFVALGTKISKTSKTLSLDITQKQELEKIILEFYNTKKLATNYTSLIHATIASILWVYGDPYIFKINTLLASRIIILYSNNIFFIRWCCRVGVLPKLRHNSPIIKAN